MFTRKFLFDAGERAVWTFAQAAAAVFLVQQAFTLEGLSVAATAGGLAVCKAVAASRVGDSTSAKAGPGA